MHVVGNERVREEYLDHRVASSYNVEPARFGNDRRSHVARREGGLREAEEAVGGSDVRDGCAK